MSNRHQLLEQIQAIQNEKSSGILSLGHEGNRVSIHFTEGLISAVSTDMPEHHLGQYLAKAGLIEESDIGSLLLESRRREIPVGRVAVDRNMVERTELRDMVQAQAIQVLTFALKNNFEIQAFENRTQHFYLPAGIDLNHLMLQLARENLKPFELHADKLIVLKNGASLSHLPWFPHELAVLSTLKAPHTFPELELSTGLDRQRLGKILSVFDTLKLLVTVDRASGSGMALAKRAGLPFESLVPEITRGGLNEKVETFRDETSFISEQFKTLKVRLAEIAATRKVKVILVTSPEAKDGKSLLALNLAATFSREIGRRTILIDGDLRNPSIHRLTGISSEPGVINYLEGEYLQPFCYMRRLERLYLMTSGGIAENPVESLSLERVHMLLEFLRTEFDTVIIDAPPLSPIADAHILHGLADGMVMVVRSGKTAYTSIEKAFRAVDRNKLLGVVLNDVKPQMFNTHYDHRYYSYKYKSRYPYGHGAAKRRGVRMKSYLDQ